MMSQRTALLASSPPSSLAEPDTHHTRAGEGHLAPIGPPLVLGTILVGKGPLEDLPDVRHVIQADCKALEHRTAEGRGDSQARVAVIGGMGAVWLFGQGRGRQCLPSAETKNKDTRARAKEREMENIATESPNQGQRWGPRAKLRFKGRGSTEDPRVQRPGLGQGEGRPVCPPDRAEKCVHLEVLPRLGPQQEHVLWETEGHCQCPPLTAPKPS